MQQMSLQTYVICSLLLYLVGGTTFYIFDRAGMRRIFSFIDRWTGDTDIHRTERGLVYGRTTGTKVIWAVIITAVTSFWFLLHGSNLMVELWTSIFDTTMVLIGFLIGPFAYKLWLGRNIAIATVDHLQEKVESGQLGKEIRQGAEDLAEGVREKVVGLSTSAGTAVKSGIDNLADKTVGKRPFETPDRPIETKKTSTAAKPSKPVVTISAEEVEKRRKKDLEGLREYVQ